MVASTAVHSNAFNFLGALQNGVDPRTGQYTITVTLPELKTYYLNGPSLPLTLSFNPISRVDRGFGYGWNLNLTHYDTSTQIISLHTGETYKVEGWDPETARAIIPEQRLDTFHLYDEGNNTYRLMHVSGEMEILVNQGTSAVPEEFYSAQGQKIILAYNDFNGYPLLNSITDANDLLVLSVTRESGSSFIDIELYPFSAEGGTPVAHYSLELTGDEGWVTQIHLPSDDNAKWEFTYKNVFGCLCIESVTSPAGSQEHLTYDNQGHAHPAPGSQPIPRVFKHVVFPFFDQPPIEHHYTYSSENFLGYGAGSFEWNDDGYDNLYKVLNDYTYHSTQTLIVNESPVLTQERTFNRYHLLIQEVTTQNGHVHRVISEYAINHNQPFHQQVAYCQLPIKKKQTWYLTGDINQLRSCTTSSTYNNRGLITSHTKETGEVEHYTYYSPDGEDSEGYFCPPDPEGFVRYLRDKTVTPTVGQLGSTAPKLLTCFSYTSLSSLAYEQMGDSILVREENLFELKDNTQFALQKTLTTYIDTPSAPLLHGRLNNKTVIVDTTALTTEYNYELDDDPTLLVVTQIDRTNVLDQQPLSKTSVTKLSIFDAEPRQRIENSIVQTYRYDSLGRLTQETIAPGTEVEASKFYTYTLSVEGSQSKQVTLNVDGVETHTYFDGLNRAVREARLDPTAGVFAGEEVRTYSAHYDAQGNLIKESSYDWLENIEHVFSRTYDYDNWGQQYSVTAPDGTRTVTCYDPIGIDVGTPAVKHPTETHYIQCAAEPTLISGLTVTVLNAFEKPIRIESLAANGKLLAIKTFAYDGFGRCIESKDESDRITRYRYDSRSRLLSTTLPDLTVVTNTYAPHPQQSLHTSISVSTNNHLVPTQLLAEQQFDGFGRLFSKTVGTLTEHYDYVEGQDQLSGLKKPSGNYIKYDYDLRLITLPKTIMLENETAPLCMFEYNKLNATMTKASNADGATYYEYDSRKNLIRETHSDSSGHELISQYGYSVNGLPLIKTDSTGMEKRYSYDQFSRLESVKQSQNEDNKSLSITFTYNRLGQLWRTTTVDEAAKTTLLVEIEYDDQGREVFRTQTLNAQAPHTYSQRWLPNNLLNTRERTVAGISQLLEQFEYDAKGRLRKHTFKGPALPKDRYGHEITRQVFRFDALDNIQRCWTTFADGQSDLALFTYSTDDACRLLSVTHDHASYPTYQAFTYDADGNMQNDEQNQHLFYDTLGRLVRVEAADSGQIVGRYRYDAHNHLIATQVKDQSETLRFYEGNRLSLAVHEGINTHLLTVNDQPIGQQQNGDEAKTLILLTDASHSVVGECFKNELLTATYTAYGERTSDQALQSMMAFNGEVLDEASGWYLLGKGYRAYNPHLMRFHSPDSMSPFGAGGLNPYVYCLGNPIALHDPTGHAGSGRNIRPKTQRPSRGGGVMEWIGVIIGVQLLMMAIVATVFFPPAAVAASAIATMFSTGVVSAATAVGASAGVSSYIGMAAYAAAYGVSYLAFSIFPVTNILDKSLFTVDVALTGAEATSIITKDHKSLGIIELAGWAPLPASLIGGIFMGGAKGIKAASKRSIALPDDPHVSAYDHFPRGSDNFNNIDSSLFDQSAPAPAPETASSYSSGEEVLFQKVDSITVTNTSRRDSVTTTGSPRKIHPTIKTNYAFLTTGLSATSQYKTSTTRL